MPGPGSTCINTVEAFGVQKLFETVHLNMLVPVANPVTEVFAKVELVNAAEPARTDQTPTPTAGLTAARVVLGELLQSV